MTRPLSARRISLTAIAAIAASGVSAPPAVAVNMGTQPWLGYGAWYITQQEGYFAGNGVDASIVDFNADTGVNTALAAGKVPVAVTYEPYLTEAHDVQEAVYISDRVLVMSNRPGRIKAELRVALPRPDAQADAAGPPVAAAPR